MGGVPFLDRYVFDRNSFCGRRDSDTIGRYSQGQDILFIFELSKCCVVARLALFSLVIKILAI